MAAGTQYIGGRIPGERIATTVQTADGPSGTGELIATSVTAPVVAGRTYKIVWDFAVEGAETDTRILCRLREDDLNGTVLQTRQVVRTAASGTTGDPGRLEGQFTAATTENKTFVGTHDPTGAGAAVNTAADAVFPTLLYVEYVKG